MTSPTTPEISDYDDYFQSSRCQSPSSPSSPTTSISPSDYYQELRTSKSPQKKKRKSWGQELPTPTTNLPPRKRAKTSEEKEQRRVERVLRNRAAAQTSRERKKAEVDALAADRDRLAIENRKQAADIERLHQELQELRTQLQSVKDVNFCKQEPQLTPPIEATDGSTTTSYFSLTLAAHDPSLVSSLNESEQSLDVTHQPAALVCDLPCLLRITVIRVLLRSGLNPIFLTFWTSISTVLRLSAISDYPKIVFQGLLSQVKSN